jgi:SAM-dependent methyltransferase
MSKAKGVTVQRNGTLIRVYGLNVGAGNSQSNEYASIDRAKGADFQFDLEDCAKPGHLLPFNADVFNQIHCSHVLEHIHNILPLMQELHRVTVAGGILTARVPYGSSDNADEDPTHVRRFFLESPGYFSQVAYGGADYGYRGDWRVHDRVLVLRTDTIVDKLLEADKLDDVLHLVHRARNIVDEFFFRLLCVKPIRAAGTGSETAPIKFTTKKSVDASLN